MVLDAGALISKHRGRGVLVDTNLLLLWLVGSVNRRRIAEFSRTSGFTEEDFDLLSRLIQHFGKLFATPRVLSQVSDLADLKGKEKLEISKLFSTAVEQVEEIYDVSGGLVGHRLFLRHGLADAAIAAVCSRGILVLTADSELQRALQVGGEDALNFNHVRPLGWR